MKSAMSLGGDALCCGKEEEDVASEWDAEATAELTVRSTSPAVMKFLSTAILAAPTTFPMLPTFILAYSDILVMSDNRLKSGSWVTSAAAVKSELLIASDVLARADILELYTFLAVSPCLVFLCFEKFPESANLTPHSLHLYGLSPETHTMKKLMETIHVIFRL